ncbi:unnamed protein product [Gongylonema pulchrum]|uniref:Conserved domain protein n=1 Tax=Gongylonema pulchrum TaxID=637853 RepID=A0A183EER6_9BILA|nr:unnamed protein product [Gongylonema pulchrum]
MKQMRKNIMKILEKCSSFVAYFDAELAQCTDYSAFVKAIGVFALDVCACFCETFRLELFTVNTGCEYSVLDSAKLYDIHAQGLNGDYRELETANCSGRTNYLLTDEAGGVRVALQ